MTNPTQDNTSRRPGMAGRVASDGGRVARAMAGGAMTALWTGLLSAELGRFSALPALAAGLLAGFALWRWSRPVGGAAPPAPPRSWHTPAAAALALATLALTLPPSEWILGGWDPGVYVHTAASLARDGVLTPDFTDAAGLDPAARELIGRQGWAAWEPFKGMRLLPDGRLSPQFLHLYPTLQALAWPIGGVRAALGVNPLLNALAVFLFFLAARQWLRPTFAFAATVLLALNPSQIWQARFGTAELLTQVLLLGGLALAGRALREPSRRSYPDALLAGAAFGLVLLTRLDTVLFLVPLGLVLLSGFREPSQRGPLAALLGTTALLALHAGLHYVYFAPFYRPVWPLVARGLLAGGGLAVLVLGAALLRPRRASRTPRTRTGLAVVVALVALFAAWVFFFWYVRPRLSVDGRVLRLFLRAFPGLTEWRWFPLLAGRHARNFWYLEHLFGPVGLALALAGVATLFFRADAVWKRGWLAGALCALAVLMLHNFHEPFMMFAARRFVPAVLPLLCLGVAAAGEALARHATRAWVRGAAVLVVPAVVLLPTARSTAALVRHRDWPGLVAWYERVVPTIPHGARVYSDQPGFAAPLRFVHGFRAYELRSDAADPAAGFELMLRQAQDAPVLWLSAREIPAPYRERFLSVGDFPLVSSAMGSARHRVPRHTIPRGGAFRLYRAKPGATPP